MAKREKKPKKGFLDGYKTYDPSVEGFGSVEQWRTAWRAMGADEALAVMREDDPLAVLGFSSLPSRTELDQRFHVLVKQHHPDHGGDPEMFKKVYAAWSILVKRCAA